MSLNNPRVTACALGVDVNGKDICSTKPVVDKIKDKLNITSDTPIEIIEDAKKLTNCKDEKCVIAHATKNNIVAANALHKFKPKGPHNSTKLLNNNNIDDVLTRLSGEHPVYHMKFQMIDFAGSSAFPPSELGTIDMLDVIKKKKMFAVVLNTDTRAGGGIHWFAVFCDFRTTPYQLEYFNSSGQRPYRQVNDWLIKTNAHINTVHKCKIAPHGTIRHQQDSETECGPYSLFYLYKRIIGTPQSLFCKNRITDAQMLDFRKSLFS